MNGRSAFNAIPRLPFLPFLQQAVCLQEVQQRWFSGWAWVWASHSAPQECWEFIIEYQVGSDLGLLQTHTLLPGVFIRTLCHTLMQVRQDVARCWHWTSGLVWSLCGTWRPCAWLPQPVLGRCWIAQVCSAGRHQALLPVLLLHGDWSCQVLIWSHP